MEQLLLMVGDGCETEASPLSCSFCLETVQRRLSELDLGGGGLVFSFLATVSTLTERQTSTLDGSCAVKQSDPPLPL